LPLILGVEEKDMEVSQIAAAAASQGRVQVANAVAAEVIKSAQAADQSMIAMLQQSADNLEALAQNRGSALQAGVGQNLDRQV
jgi:hypothetical protein